jgi:hypothetical protein
LSQRQPNDVLIWSTAGAAAREPAVDDDGGHAVDAERVRTSRRIAVVHVVNVNVVAGACNAPDHVDGVLADRAARTENLDPMSCGCHVVLFLKTFTVFCAGLSSKAGRTEIRSAFRDCIPD